MLYPACLSTVPLSPSIEPKRMSKRQLSLFDLSMIVVSLVIGMGIFRTPVVAASRAGSPGIFFLAYICVTISVAVSDPRSAFYCLIIFANFFSLFFILRRIKS